MIRIGISGWRYAGWRGTFYPQGLPQRQELQYASRALDTLEINGSFYSLQTPALYGAWHAATPEGFLFAVKGSRFITHMKRLRGIAAPLANFFASGVLRLEEKLGPFLWQLPPNMGFDEEVLDAFLARLPRSTEEAAHLARHHDTRVSGRAWMRIARDRPLRHALEVRNESFRSPRFLRLLRRHRVALVFSDNPGHWPYFEDITSSFIYARLHGAEELYSSGYDRAALETWAERILSWSPGRDVCVYFDNDAKVRAPFDARSLLALLGLEPYGNLNRAPSRRTAVG